MLEAVVERAEMLFVAKEHLPHDALHVVLGIGIEEWHAPAFLRRRKTTEHQQPRILRQERVQGMMFYGWSF